MMKSNSTIRSRALLAAAMLLPMSVPAIRPHATATAVPHLTPPPMVAQPAVTALDVEENATKLVDAMIQIESNGNPRKVGRHGERGLMQIKAGTWRDMTTRLFGKPLSFDQAFDPVLNRRVGTAYLAFLQESLLPRRTEWRSDERALLLAAYNAGPGRLRKSGFSLAGMPRTTRDYVARASALHDAYLNDMAAAVRAGLQASLRTAVTGG